MKFSVSFFMMSALILAVFLAAACDTTNRQVVNTKTAANQPTNSRNMNESTVKDLEIKTDIEALEKKINLPVRPIEVKWTEEFFDNSKGAVPGPSDYRLTALLKYDDKGLKQLTDKLGQTIMEQSLGNTEVKSWFPDEVKKQAQTNDGKTYLEGAKFSPEDFFRTPYQNGSLIRIGNTNYFVLHLFSF